MTQPAVGQTVQYFTHQTREKGANRGAHGPRLAKPIPIGPCAALVTEVRPDGTVNLIVWMPNGHMYPAFGVTQEPTTPVLHLWREVPSRLAAMEAALLAGATRAVPNGLQREPAEHGLCPNYSTGCLCPECEALRAERAGTDG